MPPAEPPARPRTPLYTAALAAAALCVAAACSLREDFVTTPGLTVEFSRDTVRFDTVFTEVGSATRSFKIYNRETRPLSLASVRVSDRAGGRFRINVDGVSGAEVRDVFLPPEDSIYVFVEVTVDPDADVSVSPFVFEGQVVVEAVDVEQVVTLEAFGQNANYIPGDRARAGFRTFSCDLGEVVFDDPRPYVLYGSLVFDECPLRLPAGTRLYIHGGLVRNDELFPDNPIFNDGLLVFADRGRLIVEGTAEDPVLIAGDRLEERFRARGGQYSGIRLGAGTGPHRISHAEIRNGVVGVFVDSAARLAIDHTEIAYTTGAAIVGYQATVSASNVLAHDNGGGAVQAIKGGDYDLDYCTLVNYGSDNPAVALSTAFEIARGRFIYSRLEARIRNSIIYGSLGDELALIDVDEPDLLDYALSDCVVRSERVPEQRPEFADRCANCVLAPPTERLFVDVRQDSFLLDSLSVAAGIATPLPGIDDDLLGAPRDPDAPSAGAYEYTFD